MKLYFIENIGAVKVTNNAFTGIKFYLDDHPLTKTSKNRFEILKNNETIKIQTYGNMFQGQYFKVNDIEGKYQITDKIAWYCYIFVFIPIIIGLILGNIPALAENGIYIVGGFIGGAIGGLFTGISLFISTLDINKFLKIILLILIPVITFLVLFGIGNAIVAGIKSVSE